MTETMTVFAAFVTLESVGPAIPLNNHCEEDARQKGPDPVVRHQWTDQQGVEPEANSRRDLAQQHRRDPGPVRDHDRARDPGARRRPAPTCSQTRPG